MRLKSLPLFLALSALLAYYSLAKEPKSPAPSPEPIAVAKPGITETAVLAGGCFWGMEEVFRKVPGVLETKVGYTGGTMKNPSYEDVSSGSTGHAESIQIQFDPKKISYEELLKVYFRMHDPTSKNRQNNDVGTQYRSEIFTENAAQAKVAEKVIKLVDQSYKWSKPVVTQVERASTFYPAEEYHQKYLVKNPHGYNDHYLRDFKF